MTGYELIKQLAQRALGTENLPEDVANMIEIQDLKNAKIPDGLETTILGGLFNKTTAVNNPEIQNELRGRMYGFVDKQLKPIYADLFGLSSEEYDKEVKKDKGNTLEMLRRLTQEYSGKINSRVQDALQKAEGADAKKIREELESEFQTKLKAANSEAEKVRASYKDLESNFQTKQQEWEQKFKDQGVTQFLNHKMSSFKIKDEVRKPIADGLPSQWDMLSKQILNEFKSNYAWVQSEDGSYQPRNKENPDSYVFDEKQNQLDATSLLTRKLAPLLSTTTEKPGNGNGGNGNRSGSIMNRIQKPANPGKPATGSKHGELKAPRL